MMDIAGQLWVSDPVFRAMAQALGVSSADEVSGVLAGEAIIKSSPDAADVHVAANVVNGRRKRRQLVPIRKRALLPVGLGAAVSYGAATTYTPDTEFRNLKRFNAKIAPGMARKQWEYNQNRLAAKEKKARKGTYAEDRYVPPPPPQPEVAKSIDWEGTFTKFDTDKRQVFGWASIVSVNGRPVVDTQGDLIDAEEMEKSAYEYVIKSRKGGDQHKRTDEGEAFHASDMIESFVVTPEKKERLGLPDDMPIGWWVGFKVNNDDTWRKVKNGEVTGFSIHGRGKREPVEGVFNPVETSAS